MIDRIKARKIKFDVLDYLENVDFVAKIEEIINNKEKYKDNMDYVQDILRKAGLDITIDNIEDSVKAFNIYLEGVMDLNNVNHYVILDYMQAINESVSDENLFLEADERLKTFIFQMVQIHKIQSNMLNNIHEVIYINEDDNCIYDRIDNKKLYSLEEYTKDRTQEEVNDLVFCAYSFMADIFITNQRKLVSKLDFDEDGYFVSLDGSKIFDDKDKKEIKEDVENWIQVLYNNTNDVGDNQENYDKVESFDIVDDVFINDKEIDKDSKERISKLKDILKASSNKIKKN